MKLIVNDKEIANYLTTLVDVSKSIPEIQLNDFQTAEALHYARTEIRNGKFRKKKSKIKEKIKSAVERDTREYFVLLRDEIKKQKNKNNLLIREKIDQLINRLGIENVLENYMKSSTDGFCKSVGLKINKNSTPVRRKNYSDTSTDCLIRNTIGNENFLTEKIDKSLPFWFIDSGYTNFIETNKKWHRLVRNHLHFHKIFDAPCNRLSMFKEFPKDWRQDGDKILVIEPGQFAASILHVDVKSWKYDIERELRQYTDKQIVFREKAPKKKRDPLYKHLLDDDYYCVVNINSNAATESIWAGVPVITLDKHITNSISRAKLSDINSLYRGPLGNWLAMLSYSQFTYEELINGTAVEIIKKYHV
jgi:hypothetical protein